MELAVNLELAVSGAAGINLVITGEGSFTELTFTDDKDINKFQPGDLVQGTIPVLSSTLYSGTGGVQDPLKTGINNTEKSLVWIKSRTDSSGHSLQDTKRGVTSRLVSNSSGTELIDSSYITSFDSDGFTINSGKWR